MNTWLILSLGLSSLTIQKGYYFLPSLYAKCKLWPKITKRHYGRAKKWTQIFWVLIQAWYHKVIFHLLLNNNQSVNLVPIHLQPAGVLICGGPCISCAISQTLKAFSSWIDFSFPQEIGTFLHDFSSKACLSSLLMCAVWSSPGAEIIYDYFLITCRCSLSSLPVIYI